MLCPARVLCSVTAPGRVLCSVTAQATSAGWLGAMQSAMGHHDRKDCRAMLRLSISNRKNKQDETGLREREEGRRPRMRGNMSISFSLCCLLHLSHPGQAPFAVSPSLEKTGLGPGEKRTFEKSGRAFV